MKKFSIMLMLLLVNQFCIANNHTAPKTMTINEFLSNSDSKRWDNLNINNKGIVVYKDSVVLNYEGIPLSDDTSLHDTELLMVIKAMKVKPRFGCNPKNIKKNGTLGCYIDNPDKK